MILASCTYCLLRCEGVTCRQGHRKTKLQRTPPQLRPPNHVDTPALCPSGPRPVITLNRTHFSQPQRQEGGLFQSQHPCQQRELPGEAEGGQAPAVHTPFYQAHTPEVTGEKKVSGEESAQGACSAEQCGRAQPCGDSGDQGPSLRSVLSGGAARAGWGWEATVPCWDPCLASFSL